MDTRKRRERRLVSGIGVSGGCAAGPLFFLNRAEAESIDPEESLPASPTEEWERLAKALETVKEELGLLAERTQASVGEEEAGIFRIHAMLLEEWSKTHPQVRVLYLGISLGLPVFQPSLVDGIHHI
mgnify:CR=1 FL=1